MKSLRSWISWMASSTWLRTRRETLASTRRRIALRGPDTGGAPGMFAVRKIFRTNRCKCRLQPQVKQHLRVILSHLKLFKVYFQALFHWLKHLEEQKYPLHHGDEARFEPHICQRRPSTLQSSIGHRRSCSSPSGCTFKRGTFFNSKAVKHTSTG